MKRDQNFIFEYRQAGVTFIIPPQAEPISVRRLPKGTLRNKPPEAGIFHPIRLVLNFELIARRDPWQPLEKFDPPITIRVRYTREDFEKAHGELKLGYWDGEKWTVFTHSKHHFHLIPDKKPADGGTGEVVVASWIDPALGWGN